MSNIIHPKYRSDIDGLRAIAVLSVVGFHAFPSKIKGGFIGVDIFFVISGFLISLIIISNLEASLFSISEFYNKRIRRLFPALLTVMTVSFIFGWFFLLSDEYSQLEKHISAGAIFILNFFLYGESGYFDNLAETKPMLHLWSLAIEEQFYIFWPIILAYVWRKKRSFLLITLVIATISFVINIYLTRNDLAAAFYWPISRFWELMIGGLLAYITLHRSYIIKKGANIQSIFGFILIILGLLFIDRNKSFPGWWALLPTFGTFFIISAGSNAFLNRYLLSNKLMVMLGLISYPIYLWHWPLLSFANIIEGGTPAPTVRLVLVLMSFFLAFITYKFIEIPIRFSVGRKWVFILISGMIILFILSILGPHMNGFDLRATSLRSTAYKQKFSLISNPESQCDFYDENSKIKKYCKQYLAKNSLKTILLWGDSSTTAWLPVFQNIGKYFNYTIINISHPSCPPLLSARKTYFKLSESLKYCKDGKFQGEIINSIKIIKPDAVVIIGAFNAYSVHDGMGSEFITNKEGVNANYITNKETIESSLPQTLNELSKIAKVIVFKSWPILPDNLESKISLKDKLLRRGNPQEFDVGYFDKQRNFVNQVLDKVHLKDLYFFDPAQKICKDTCVTYFDGVKLYSDTYHITASGSMLYRKDLSELIEFVLSVR